MCGPIIINLIWILHVLVSHLSLQQMGLLKQLYMQYIGDTLSLSSSFCLRVLYSMAHYETSDCLWNRMWGADGFCAAKHTSFSSCVSRGWWNWQMCVKMEWRRASPSCNSHLLLLDLLSFLKSFSWLWFALSFWHFFQIPETISTVTAEGIWKKVT